MVYVSYPLAGAFVDKGFIRTLRKDIVVLRVGNLYGFMMRDKTPRFTGEELDILKKALEERALPPKKYPAPDSRDEIRMTVEAYQRLFVIAQSGKDAMLKCLKEHPEFLTPPAVS